MGPALLTNWITDVRKPNATKPLVVEIGPGTFKGTLFCQGVSNVSVKGSGPENTILETIQGNNCYRLNVQDLTVSNSFIGIYWTNAGTSFWTNVHVRDGLYAWSEVCPQYTERAIHYWFNSRLHSTAKTYLASCSENWLFSSEIVASGPGLAGSLKPLLAYRYSTAPSTLVPEIHVYGSVVRTIAAPGVSYNAPKANSNEGDGLLAAFAGANAKNPYTRHRNRYNR